MYKRFLFASSILLFIFFAHNFAQAESGSFINTDKIQAQDGELINKAGYANVSEDAAPEMIATVIRAFIGLLGIIFIILFITAGWKWFIAGGDADKVKEAKDRMFRAVIGLTIIISAYIVTYFVFKSLNDLNAVQGTSGGSEEYQ
jgi:hypothetical protein